MDNMDNSLQDIMNGALENLRGMVQSEDMVFKPIYLDENTMAIPLTKVSVGFVSGGGGSRGQRRSSRKKEQTSALCRRRRRRYIYDADGLLGVL